MTAVASLSSRQRFLDELVDKKQIKSDSEIIKILNWNIQNPSLGRAIKQTDWLEKSDFDVVALSEVKFSEGGFYIKDRLRSLGYKVIFTPENKKPEIMKYGVMLAARGSLKEASAVSMAYLPRRVISVICNFWGKDVLVSCIHVPVWKDQRMEKFLDRFTKLIADKNLKKKFANWISLGDFNLLETNHIPSYAPYKKWEYYYEVFNKYGFVDCFRFLHPTDKEYSWFGRKGNGYRFDHAFVSENALSLVKSCFYIHKVRIEKLSDHSAMCLEIKKF